MHAGHVSTRLWRVAAGAHRRCQRPGPRLAVAPGGATGVQGQPARSARARRPALPLLLLRRLPPADGQPRPGPVPAGGGGGEGGSGVRRAHGSHPLRAGPRQPGWQARLPRLPRPPRQLAPRALRLPRARRPVFLLRAAGWVAGAADAGRIRPVGGAAAEPRGCCTRLFPPPAHPCPILIIILDRAAASWPPPRKPNPQRIAARWIRLPCTLPGPLVSLRTVTGLARSSAAPPPPPPPPPPPLHPTVPCRPIPALLCRIPSWRLLSPAWPASLAPGAHLVRRGCPLCMPPPRTSTYQNPDTFSVATAPSLCPPARVYTQPFRPPPCSWHAVPSPLPAPPPCLMCISFDSFTTLLHSFAALCGMPPPSAPDSAVHPACCTRFMNCLRCELICGLGCRSVVTQSSLSSFCALCLVLPRP